MTGYSFKEMFKHPNNLTMVRVYTMPVIVLLLIYPSPKNSLIAAIVFSAAAITDFLDGFLARRRGLVSEFGKVLDPLADKLLICSSLIMLCSIRWIPGWIVCIIIGREIAVTGLRGIAAEKTDVSASLLGKYKTGFQIAAIIPLLIHYPYMGIDFHIIGMFFLWVALIFTLWSGFNYFKKFFNVIW